jgi:hypothetical protein
VEGDKACASSRTIYGGHLMLSRVEVGAHVEVEGGEGDVVRLALFISRPEGRCVTLSSEMESENAKNRQIFWTLGPSYFLLCRSLIETVWS